MSFFKQRGMLLVRLFEAIYPSHLTVAIANIHKIKMEKTQFSAFFKKRKQKAPQCLNFFKYH